MNEKMNLASFPEINKKKKKQLTIVRMDTMIVIIK